MNRIRTLPFAAAILYAAIFASAQNRHFGLPFLVRIDGNYGYMDGNCRMVIPAQYGEAFDFTEGLAAVKIGQNWGYIDQTGAIAIPAKFAGAFHFSDGMASVRLDEDSPLWGFIDKTGRVAIPPQFGMPLWFAEGLVEGYGEKNKIDVSYVTSVIAPSGKVLWTQPEPAVDQSESFYPKPYVVASMGINLTPTIRPGEYTITVQVKDGAGGQTFEEKHTFMVE